MRAMVGLALNGWLFGVPVVLMAWAALRLLHRAPARVRYVVVLAAFVAAIAMPLIPRDAQVAVTAVEAVADAIAFPLALGWAVGAAVLMAWAARRLPDRAPARVVVIAAALVVLAIPLISRLEAVADALAFPLALVWAVGVVVLLAREVIGHLRLRVAGEDAPAEMRRLLDWPARVPLAVSDRTPPLTIGLFAPRVVLPRDLAATFPPDVVRRIARHELAHCRWRDPLVYALMRAAAAVFWLWPVWPLLRWARREREVAADEFALHAARGDEEHYVAALLRLAHAHRSPASAMAANDLEFRARRILGMPRRTSAAISAAVLALASTLIAIAQPVNADPEERVVVIQIVKEIP